MNLSEIKIGGEAVINEIFPKCKIKNRIIDMGFIKGTKVKVLFSAPFGGPIEVLIRGYKIVLRKNDAKLISIT